MDLDLAAVDGGCLVISQFTLAGTVRKGRRPSFDAAEAPELADKIQLNLPDEAARRVGQSIAAASLPKIG